MKPLKEKFNMCFFNNIFIDLTLFGITFFNLNLIWSKNIDFSFQILGLSDEVFSLIYFNVSNVETELILLTKYVIDK